MPFPVVMAHRWWAAFSIPVVLICAEGFFNIGNFLKKLKIDKFFILFVYIMLIIGILITSGYPKYKVQTSYWPPGVDWVSHDEMQIYLNHIKPLPYHTKVFTACTKEAKVLAFDKFAEPWDINYQHFKKSFFNKSADEIQSWLKTRNYEYFIIDLHCVNKFGENETNFMLQEIVEHPQYFQVVYPTQETQPMHAFIFRVN